MIKQGFELTNVKKIGVNSQSCKFYSSFENIFLNWKISGREISKFGISYLP